MGMYTEVRGWIKLSVIEFKNFEKLMNEAKGLSPRASQCVSSTCFNIGSNWKNYVFIGGSIKNYDDEWRIYLKFLSQKLPIEDYNIELRYEEADSWTKICLT